MTMTMSLPCEYTPPHAAAAHARLRVSLAQVQRCGLEPTAGTLFHEDWLHGSLGHVGFF